MTYHARTGFRRCGTSSPQLSSGPLGRQNQGYNQMKNIRLIGIALIALALILFPTHTNSPLHAQYRVKSMYPAYARVQILLLELWQ
jgi:hypothetical protein